MSGSTTELSLSTAVDADDNADYLTIALANSLRTIDALFNNVTGHNHASAHQGGPISTTSLKGAYDQPDWYRSTGHTSPFATSGVGLELYYDTTGGGTIQTYNRGSGAYGPTQVLGSTVTISIGGTGAAITIAADRSITIPGTVTMQGAASVAGVLTASANISAAGSLLLTGSGARITFNAGGYIADYAGGYVNCNQLTVTPGAFAAANSTINGTLAVNGVTTHSAAVNVNAPLSASQAVTAGPNLDGVVTATGTGMLRVETGTGTTSPANNTGNDVPVTFARAFSSPPRVIACAASPSGAADINGRFVAVEDYTITTTGFTWRGFNTTGGPATIGCNWMAIGW